MTKTWYQVPARGEEPSEEMKEWLHEMDQDWDGDDEGVVIYPPGGGEPTLASHGDWIWRDHETNTYYVITQSQREEHDALLRELGIV